MIGPTLMACLTLGFYHFAVFELMSILFLDDVPHNVPHDKLHNQKKTVTLGACFFSENVRVKNSRTHQSRWRMKPRKLGTLAPLPTQTRVVLENPRCGIAKSGGHFLVTMASVALGGMGVKVKTTSLPRIRTDQSVKHENRFCAEKLHIENIPFLKQHTYMHLRRYINEYCFVILVHMYISMSCVSTFCNTSLTWITFKCWIHMPLQISPGIEFSGLRDAILDIPSNSLHGVGFLLRLAAQEVPYPDSAHPVIMKLSHP